MLKVKVVMGFGQVILLVRNKITSDKIILVFLRFQLTIKLLNIRIKQSKKDAKNIY